MLDQIASVRLTCITRKAQDEFEDVTQYDAMGRGTGPEHEAMEPTQGGTGLNCSGKFKGGEKATRSTEARRGQGAVSGQLAALRGR